jgi:hypothetical protein
MVEHAAERVTAGIGEGYAFFLHDGLTAFFSVTKRINILAMRLKAWQQGVGSYDYRKLAAKNGTVIAAKRLGAKNGFTMVNWECLGASNLRLPFGF